MTVPSGGGFTNSYADDRMAGAYAKLEFPGTYHLAFRDLPMLLGPGGGRSALDFGCGAGRSTRFLRDLGFDAIGIDISPEMIREAEALDPRGRYVLMDDGDFSQFPCDSFDLILSAFTFDNIPSVEHRVRLMIGLGQRLRGNGVLMLLGSAPEMYTHDWASFSTTQFPENARARSGDVVRCVITDVEDRRPVEDVFWLDEDYRSLFAGAGLDVAAIHRPLATGGEPCAWVNETRVAPWVIYVTARAADAPRGLYVR